MCKIFIVLLQDYNFWKTFFLILITFWKVLYHLRPVVLVLTSSLSLWSILYIEIEIFKYPKAPTVGSYQFSIVYFNLYVNYLINLSKIYIFNVENNIISIFIWIYKQDIVNLICILDKKRNIHNRSEIILILFNLLCFKIKRYIYINVWFQSHHCKYRV